MTLQASTCERQPSWLPFVLARVLGVLAAATVVLASTATVRAEGDDIRIAAVDSSRLADPSTAGTSVVPRPVGGGVDDMVRDINRRGGLLGRRLAVIHENDRCEADEAAAIAARAVEQGARIVVGHVCSSGAIRAAAIYAEAGVLMIATGPRHPRLTVPAGRRGIFRLAGRDDRQAESIATLIATSFPAARMAVVHDQSLQGRGMADEIRRSAIGAHVAPLLVAPFVTGTKDYGALVAQIIEAKIDLVVFSSQPLEASIILDQAQSAGARVETAVGTDAFAADEPPARLLAATREFLVMLPWPGQEAGVGAGAGTGDVAPHDSARKLAGAAVEIWARAVARAGSFEVDGVVAAMSSPIAAAGDTVRFDDKGDAMVPSFVPHVWREGRWQVRE